MEKNMKKYICVTESLCCIADINTTLIQLYFSIKIYKKMNSKVEIYSIYRNRINVKLDTIY